MNNSVTIPADPSQGAKNNKGQVGCKKKNQKIQGAIQKAAHLIIPSVRNLGKYAKSTSPGKRTVRADLEHRPETRILSFFLIII